MYICDRCGKRGKSKIKLWVAGEDPIGFIFLSVALMAPIGFMTYLCIITLYPESFLEEVFAFEGMTQIVFIGLPSLLVVGYWYYRIGHKVYVFFGKFVNFKFSYVATCEPCGLSLKEIHLPGES
ncbi:hypothetical protein ACJJIG_18695 [Microbulbifer sp. SSSA007]|uniref:hypothetical protein n=1 Tax=Microbulbifer sp. SSSA007 TaxID=3243379 RepID=UPI00403A4B8C